MPVNINGHESLDEILILPESDNIEFKEAKNNFDFEKLAKYSCAMANRGGGRIVLGVTDKRPRMPVGSNAFPQPEQTCTSLSNQLHLKIAFDIYPHEGKNVLVFIIPSRPIGIPVEYKGIYWMRNGEELVRMSPGDLRSVFAESGNDFSAEVCSKAEFSDLVPDAISVFRKRWIAKSGNMSLLSLTDEQLLRDCEAITRDGITNAALILFGSREALGRLLGQAEVIFEYRSTEASGPANQREEFRQGFFSYYDKLWELINKRNEKQHYQDGLFLVDVPTFDERSIREALLNAVSHRNYQFAGSVFIKQYLRKIMIESPGGFPLDITLDNILDRQSPRNRRISDIFSKCGLVERSGQGMNLMFEMSIKEGKALPDFKGTDDYHVTLTLDGQIRAPKLLEFLEKIGQQTMQSFSTLDFLIIDKIFHDQKIPSSWRYRLSTLAEMGIIEKIDKNNYILGRKYYVHINKKGTYTRKAGLDRGMKKALLLKHVNENNTEGSRLEELYQVLPDHGRSQIQLLLRELKNEKKIHVHGQTRAGRWYSNQCCPDCPGCLLDKKQ